MDYDPKELKFIQCRECGYTSDDLNEFAVNSAIKCGVKTLCRPCDRNLRTIRRLINRKMVDDACNVPCKACGNRYPTCAMDFHHRDGTTKREKISSMLNGSEQQLREEMAKCDIYCSNCHRILHSTWTRRD